MKIILLLAVSILASPALDATPYHFRTVQYPGADSTYLDGLNDKGHAVGYYFKDQQGGAFIYQDGVFTDLKYPGGEETLALGLDNNGTVVGIARYGPIRGPAGREFEDAWIWKDGSFTQLQHPGALRTTPYDISNDGVVVTSWLGNTWSGALYSGGAWTEVEFPPASPNDFVYALDRNVSGDIVGAFDSPGGYAFLLTKGNIVPLPWTGTNKFGASAINDKGDIAGSSTSSALVFSNGTIISAAPPASFTSEARDINNLGQVVGFYMGSDSRTVGFIATPIPEPATSTLLVCGAFALILSRKLTRRAVQP